MSPVPTLLCTLRIIQGVLVLAWKVNPTCQEEVLSSTSDAIGSESLACDQRFDVASHLAPCETGAGFDPLHKMGQPGPVKFQKLSK